MLRERVVEETEEVTVLDGVHRPPSWARRAMRMSRHLRGGRHRLAAGLPHEQHDDCRYEE